MKPDEPIVVFVRRFDSSIVRPVSLYSPQAASIAVVAGSTPPE